MKLLYFAAFCVAVASARPRFLVIPLEDVEFVGESPEALPVYPMMPEQYRYRRDAADEDEREFVPGPPRELELREFKARPDLRPDLDIREFQPRVPTANRRSGGIPDGPHGGAPGSFIGAIKGAGIPSAGDSLAAGSSSYHSPPKGSDYVDYGAYTGKKGAFGWYSDHPVNIITHGYH